METTTTDLIEAVERERERRQMSGNRFSREILGISPAYWCLLRSGKRAVTLDILRLLMRKLPEVTPEVTIFVMRQGNNGNVSDIAIPNKGVKPSSPTNMYANPGNPPKTALKPPRGANHE